MPASYSWSLPTSTVAPVTVAKLQTPVLVAIPARNKRGLLRPFQRDGATDLATVSGDDRLVAQVQAVLGSDTGYPWRHRFRARLDRLRNQRNNPGLTAFALFYAREAVTRWLPGVVVLSLTAQRGKNSIDMDVAVARADDLRTNPTTPGVKVPVSVPTQARSTG